MNLIHGTIQQVSECDGMHWIDVLCNGRTFGVLTLQLSPDLHEGCSVDVMIKETETSLSAEPVEHISISNQVSGEVVAIDEGVLVSLVTVETPVGRLTSLISTRGRKQLNISVGGSVNVLMKASSLSLSKASS
ncbi:MAG: TOBE domain-containing protein [Sulfurimonadaceae bacterium]|nr:TOBE domain-containing protein [Sulfurimonadaceae bacterium]